MSIAFIYPGQGSQRVGMADALIEVWPSYPEHIEQAEERIPGIGRAMSDGPGETLAETRYAQPAIFLVSYGWHEVLVERGVRPAMVAGHSLGEYSALAATGVLDFRHGLELVAGRGALMGEAAGGLDGAMAAVIGLDRSVLEPSRVVQLGDAFAEVEIANLNGPGQVVISGPRAAVEKASAALLELGARRVLPLAVSGAFHSAAMKPASEAFAPLLRAAMFADASVPVVQNTTASPATAAEELREHLLPQMTGPVFWQDSIERMAADGARVFVECGPGTVLRGLVRRTLDDATVLSVDDPADFEAIRALGAGSAEGASNVDAGPQNDEVVEAVASAAPGHADERGAMSR